MAKEKEQKEEKPLKSIKYQENPIEKGAKELSPEMVAQGLRKWLLDDKKG